MKKIFFAVCCLICSIIFLCVQINKSSSNSTPSTDPSTSVTESTVAPTEESTEPTSEPEAEKNPNYKFKNAAFYCVENDEMLFSYKENARLAPASLAKILTATVAYYYSDPDEVFTVGSELSMVEPHSSLCLISKGQKIALNDLIVGLMLPSGNDAAYTIAVNVARNLTDEDLPDKEAVEFFCELMNGFARLIGMENSNFTSPDGWDDKNQYTSASDLIKLTQCALGIEELRSIISLNQKYVVFKSGQNITWKNTNKLLDSGSKHYNEYAIGVKTGSTKKAGNCLVSAFVKDGLTYISVVCGTATTDSRYEETNKLFDSYVG